MSQLVSDQPDDLHRVIDRDGSVVDGASVSLSDDTLLALYEDLKLARRFDRKAVALQRQGRMGTYPPIYGQEGAQVASVHALDDEDWLFPSYRENGAMLARGVSMSKNLEYWMGSEAGNAALRERNVFTVTNPIATQIPLATGLAWGAKLKGDNRAALVHFGDGATSEGDFHEGLNFAGVFDAPVVFFCNNNQWAISVPREKQTKSATIAQKAVAYGFEGVRVDGMDPIAVYEVTRDAVQKAKNPGDEPAPTLIEAFQYRLGAHSTSDDPGVYRDEERTEKWRQMDPVPRFERFMLETGRLDQEDVDAIEQDIEDRLNEAVEQAEAATTDPRHIFEHVYAQQPKKLREQQAYLESLREEFGDDALLED
ncbi:pyruvate dehydrogenase (acetyl-transferring) E1 component subunit alpha [Haloarchaeobius sp. HME9146]|uniref:pyruvate dehydrogenase (acetyl-transferring) E1 component subunit alpha n=1 Tax=Haloarchaeobius sp. HME9146 TaxID=2978732 RepID=UPI0021C208FB|nr:pyruvate dehydrogenase (acetyl-transferring) E1 component subunit alpha [Haloarchaeobius sp. HME9146]MCT9095590.1 pyruvate dehydrogenase (acetyl-transferring) E1 component subunit alpha [Haloarchaeobius sp. HME9146]